MLITTAVQVPTCVVLTEMQFGSLNATIRLLVEYELLKTSGFLRFSVIAQSELHDLSEQVIVQFLWDPSATKTLHQLGGKPKHKKGECQGLLMDGPSYGSWALPLA
jgi:hypothetical protein